MARKADGTRIGDMELAHTVGEESMPMRQPARFTFQAATDLLVVPHASSKIE